MRPMRRTFLITAADINALGGPHASAPPIGTPDDYTVQPMSDSFLVSADALGSAVTVSIDTSVYGLIAIFKTAYWWTDRAYLYLRWDDGEGRRILVEIRSKTDIQADALVSIGRQFCNSLIDHQVRQEVLAETLGVRDRLLARAFGEGRTDSAAPVIETGVNP